MTDLPEVPDLAVICAPRNAVPELFARCAEKGVDMVIIIAQGFSDGDEEGKQMNEELIALAKEKGVRVIGPNTLGVVNNLEHFCTFFMRFINNTSPVGVLCQSGVFVVGATELTTGIGICIDTGNTADVDFGDLIGHLAIDPRLKIINVHMEGQENGVKFMEKAKKAVRHKPVLVLKTGRSDAGARVAGSHTGSLAGEDRIFDAAFKQCGLIRVDDVEELNDINKAFLTFDRIGGNRLAVVTISGGGGIITADACDRYGMKLATFNDKTLAVLREMSPGWMRPANPVDVWPAAMLSSYEQAYRRTLLTVLDDPNVDAVVCITSSFLAADEDFLDITALIREAAASGSGKPVVAWTYGKRLQDYARELEKEHNVLAFPTLERAVRALSALYRYHHLIRKTKSCEQPVSISPGFNDVQKIVSNKANRALLLPESFKLLEAYGIPAAPWGLARNAAEAAVLAEKIGYPVVVKAVSPELSHKTEKGAVKLGIGDREALLKACRELENTIGCFEGLVIQEQKTGGAELLLGFKRDPQFGPVLVFGHGGIFSEILNDVSLRVAPLDREEILELIGETKVSRILSGARGLPPANMEAIVDCCLRLARLAVENPFIGELDVNPLLATPEGAYALDARVVL